MSKEAKLNSHIASERSQGPGHLIRRVISKLVGMVGINKPLPKEVSKQALIMETPIPLPAPQLSIRQQMIKEQLSSSDKVEVDGERVRNLRITLKKTQADLALEIGINRFKLLKLERRPGWRFLPKETAETLAAALGTNIEELILPPVGQVLRQWRTARGLSLADLARKIKIEQVNQPLHKHYISAVERRVYRNPKMKSLKTLATGLEIPDYYLIKRVLPDEVESFNSTPADGSVHRIAQ